MCRLLCLFIVLGFSLSAHAQKKAAAKPAATSAEAALTGTSSISSQSLISEFFSQAPEGQNWLSPGAVYISGQTKYSNSTKTDNSAMLFGFEYERGIAPTASAGVRVVYASTNAKKTKNGTADVKTDIRGLGDLEFFLKGHTPLEDGKYIWYGVKLSMSPGKATNKAKDGGNKWEQSANSGGNGFTPYVGLSVPMNGYTLGGKLSIERRLTDATLKETDASGQTSTIKMSSGETTKFSVFAETPISTGFVGTYLEYAAKNTTDLESGGGTGTISGYNTISLVAYGTHSFSDTALLRGELLYGKLASDSAAYGSVDSSSLFGASISGRFTF